MQEFPWSPWLCQAVSSAQLPYRYELTTSDRGPSGRGAQARHVSQQSIKSVCRLLQSIKPCKEAGGPRQCSGSALTCMLLAHLLRRAALTHVLALRTVCRLSAAAVSRPQTLLPRQPLRFRADQRGLPPSLLLVQQRCSMARPKRAFVTSARSAAKPQALVNTVKVEVAPSHSTGALSAACVHLSSATQT